MDYREQYEPEYTQRLLSQKAPVGHREARVRISRVKPRYPLRFLKLPKKKRFNFYIEHACKVPVAYKFGVWGVVSHVP